VRSWTDLKIEIYGLNSIFEISKLIVLNHRSNWPY